MDRDGGVLEGFLPVDMAASSASITRYFDYFTYLGSFRGENRRLQPGG